MQWNGIGLFMTFIFNCLILPCLAFTFAYKHKFTSKLAFISGVFDIPF